MNSFDGDTPIGMQTGTGDIVIKTCSQLAGLGCMVHDKLPSLSISITMSRCMYNHSHLRMVIYSRTYTKSLYSMSVFDRLPFPRIPGVEDLLCCLDNDIESASDILLRRVGISTDDTHERLASCATASDEDLSSLIDQVTNVPGDGVRLLFSLPRS